jgi:hypothetical protein
METAVQQGDFGHHLSGWYASQTICKGRTDTFREEALIFKEQNSS